VLDEKGDFLRQLQPGDGELQSLDEPAEIEAVKVMVRRHADLTDSILAGRVLAGWSGLVNKFVKVMPKDYQRMLQAIRRLRPPV